MWIPITTSEELRALFGVNDFLARPVILLKHSTRCSFSSLAKSRLEQKPDDRISYYLIDVLAHRPVSNLLAEITGVRHESPQAFLVSNGKVLDVKSHMAIKPSEFALLLGEII